MKSKPYISRRLRFGAPLLFVALACGVAFADEAADKSRAQKLFAEGVGLRKAGKDAEGCAKLRESLGLFAVANTLFNVAQCDENEGRIASALEHWQRGLALVDAKDPRSKVAKERVDALSPRVPRVRVVLPKGKDVPTVSLDGVEFSREALAEPLAVEPGKHVFLIKLEGRQDRRHEIELAEKERTEFVATPGAPLEGPAAPSSSSSDVPPPLPTGSVSVPPPPSGSGRRTAGFVVGGVGVAGLVAAGVTGGMLKGVHDDCKDNLAACDRSKYQTLYVANAVTFGVGIAGVGAGLVLLLTAPKAEDAKNARLVPAPLVIPGGGGIGLSGRF